MVVNQLRKSMKFIILALALCIFLTETKPLHKSDDQLDNISEFMRKFEIKKRLPPLESGFVKRLPPLESGFVKRLPPLEYGFVKRLPPMEASFAKRYPPLESGFAKRLPPIESGFFKK